MPRKPFDREQHRVYLRASAERRKEREVRMTDFGTAPCSYCARVVKLTLEDQQGWLRFGAHETDGRLPCPGWGLAAHPEIRAAEARRLYQSSTDRPPHAGAERNT